MCSFCRDYWKSKPHKPSEPKDAERELFEKRNKAANTWPEDDDNASTAAESTGTAHSHHEAPACSSAEDVIPAQSVNAMVMTIMEVVAELRTRLQAVENALAQNRNGPPGLPEPEEKK